ncbi:MAG: DoxX family protein [Gemmatimonadota bacterium]
MKRGLNPELGLAILRVVIGVIFIAHGYPKIAGGVAGTADFLGQLGVPLAGFFAWVVTLLEFFGGIALVIGFLVTPLALLFSIHMLTGIVLVHAANGFYVIGPGQGGIEFNLLLIAGLLALVLAGPGMAALDSRAGGGEAAAPAGGQGGAG